MSRNQFGLLVLCAGSLCTFAAVTYILRSQWQNASRGAVLLAAAVLTVLLIGAFYTVARLLLHLTGDAPSVPSSSPSHPYSSASTRMAEFARLLLGNQLGAREADQNFAVVLKRILAEAESDTHADTLLLRYFRTDPDEPDPTARLAQFHLLLSGYRRGNEATAHTRILIQRFIDDLERRG